MAPGSFVPRTSPRARLECRPHRRSRRRGRLEAIGGTTMTLRRLMRSASVALLTVLLVSSVSAAASEGPTVIDRGGSEERRVGKECRCRGGRYAERIKYSVIRG